MDALIPKYQQGRNHREKLGATAPMVGRICPPGWNRVKVSENLGATAVVPVAPVDTSLKSIRLQHYIDFKPSLARNILTFILYCGS